MKTTTLQQQIKSCMELEIHFFDGIHGENNLLCPKCDTVGKLESAGHLLCPNNNCRVGRFFTG